LRGVAGAIERLVNAAGDEVERRSALHLQRLARVMREDEDRRVVRRILPPPTAPGIGSPRTVAAAEHVAAHDVGPDVPEQSGDDVVVEAGLAAGFHSVHLAEAPRCERPLVEQAAALAERILDALPRAGDIAVERHGDLKFEKAHGFDSQF
jgi:hypothetical protein